MPRLVAFTGGWHRATDPHLIQPNEGVVYHNIDHIPGPLAPMKSKVLEPDITAPKRYGYEYENDVWYFSDEWRDFVEYQNVLYVGNPDGETTKVYDGNEYKLGIEAPGNPPAKVRAISRDLVRITEFELSILYLNAGDLPPDTEFQYRVCNKNADGIYSDSNIFTIETPDGAAPAAVVGTIVNQNEIEVEANVYREHLGTWRLVGTLLPGETMLDDTFDISAAAPITDIVIDDSGPLNGTLRYAYTYYNSDTGVESVETQMKPAVYVNNGIVEITEMLVSADPQVDKKRIYRIGGNLTSFHLVDTVDNSVTEYTDEIGDLDLTGELMDTALNYPCPENINWLTEAYAMLFGSLGSKLYFTPIGEPDKWPPTYFLDFPSAIRGIAKTPIGLLIFTRHQTHLVTGTGPFALAQQLLSGSQGCLDGKSIVEVQGAAYWASSDGICISDGGQVRVWTRPKLDKYPIYQITSAVVYDQQYHLVRAAPNSSESGHTILILDVERDLIKTADMAVETLILSRDDRLYGYKDSYYHDVYLFEPNNPAGNLTYTYWSPEFIGPALCIQKVYKNFYMYSSGNVTITILIDGVEVQTQTVTTTDNHQIKIPTEATRGFYIQFKITGTGTVKEINWAEGNANA